MFKKNSNLTVVIVLLYLILGTSLLFSDSSTTKNSDNNKSISSNDVQPCIYGKHPFFKSCKDD